MFIGKMQGSDFWRKFYATTVKKALRPYCSNLSSTIRAMKIAAETSPIEHRTFVGYINEDRYEFAWATEEEFEKLLH
jgi:hypothetical protein